MAPAHWKVVGTSVAGFSHQDDGSPCQDYHASLVVNKVWVVAAVSDGAGSAARSVEGSKLISEGVVRHLSLEIEKPNATHAIDSPVIFQWLEKAILKVRDHLQASSEAPLADFHATLIGAIAGPECGFLFHIGDGAGFAATSSDITDCVMSLPENGEYANETYFFTQDDWREHLRITAFDKRFNFFALMSDGVTPFALAPKTSLPHAPFFEPLSKFLSKNTEDVGQEALTATLNREAIRRITGDDKTLVWATRTTTDE